MGHYSLTYLVYSCRWETPNSRWGDTCSNCVVDRQYPEIWICLRRGRCSWRAAACSLCIRRSQMYRKNAFFVGILAAGCLVAASVVALSIGHAQTDPRVTKSMETLKSMTAKLGAPKLEVNEVVDPALYFGSTRINNTPSPGKIRRLLNRDAYYSQFAL